MALRASMSFRNVVELSMEALLPSCHSLNVQPIITIAKDEGSVDNKGRFIDIYVGWPGRVHDACVFANSTRRGEAKTLFPDWTERIGNIDVHLVMFGDLAYPLLPWLMKVFPNNGNLTRSEKRFKYRLSKARVVVEHT